MIHLRPEAVLDFWFGAPGSREYGQQRRDWFAQSPEFDVAVEAGFGAHFEAAAAGRLDDWQENAAGALALVLLLDQFPRQLFRGTARAFASDARAVAVSDGALLQGFDRSRLPVERIFFYLPFEHAEDAVLQDRAVALFTELAQEHPGFDRHLEYAWRHRDVIARFGRFPHRNAALGRASTVAETEFLKSPGSRF